MNNPTIEALTKLKKKQKELNETLEDIYANLLDYSEVEEKLLSSNVSTFDNNIIQFLEFLEEVSQKNTQKGDNLSWRGMDYLITEIVKKASDHLHKKKQLIGQRAHKKENNNCFINEISGKIKSKIYSR